MVALITENWRAVLGYEGLYEVSDMGNVRRLHKDRMMSCTPDRDGYRRAGLRNGKRKWFRVSSLVLSAFVSPRPNKYEAAHENGINSDDRLCNLAWKTTLENHADKHRHMTMANGERCGRSKLSDADVAAIRSEYLGGGISSRQLAAKFGVGKTQVLRILRFESRTKLTYTGCIGAIKADQDYDPTPYCSYGHKTKASCDCGSIAENE